MSPVSVIQMTLRDITLYFHIPHIFSAFKLYIALLLYAVVVILKKGFRNTGKIGVRDAYNQSALPEIERA
jgi:hypothetical protein